MVHISDNLNPTIEGPGSEAIVNQFSIHLLKWNITEINNGSYIIMRNDTQVASGDFYHHVNVTLQANTTAEGY